MDFIFYYAGIMIYIHYCNYMTDQKLNEILEKMEK